MPSEPLPPCPVCGRPMSGIGDTIHHCAACALTGPRAVLEGLAAAAALAAAVGRLEGRSNIGALARAGVDTSERWAVSAVGRGATDWSGVHAPTLAAALVALAGGRWGMRISFFFRWYDLWIGAYVDTERRAVYICPLPTIGVKVTWGGR